MTASVYVVGGGIWVGVEGTLLLCTAATIIYAIHFLMAKFKGGCDCISAGLTEPAHDMRFPLDISFSSTAPVRTGRLKESSRDEFTLGFRYGYLQ